MVVGDDDLGAAEVGEHVGRHQLAVRVVAVGVARQQDAQAVLDGDAGRDDQEAAARSACCPSATALTVCQAMSMAMTVVLPLPVAILQRDAGRPGLAWSLAPRDVRGSCRRWRRLATSVSQISVSTASTWQKKGREPVKAGSRQCRSRRAVTGVTPQSAGLGIWRQAAT